MGLDWFCGTLAVGFLFRMQCLTHSHLLLFLHCLDSIKNREPVPFGLPVCSLGGNSSEMGKLELAKL